MEDVRAVEDVKAPEDVRAEEPRARGSLARTLVYLGLASVCAGVAYSVVRVTRKRPPVDPTTERIRSLIDEANRLLKELDDKKSR